MNFNDILSQYKLLCFDFDGLLVNTEYFHYLAYQQMLKNHKCNLKWNFATYCLYAHADKYSLRDAITILFPHILDINEDWEYFRDEKQVIYEGFLNDNKISLMPGVDTILKMIEKSNVNSCVVTNSPNDHLDIIRKHLPELNVIPRWIGRNEYKNPKPDPDPYLAALDIFAPVAKSEVLAFEDTFKGSQAALAAGIHLLYVCEPNTPHLKEPSMKNIPHVASFLELVKKVYSN